MITAVASCIYLLLPGVSVGLFSAVVPLILSSILSQIGIMGGVPMKRIAFACCCYAGAVTFLAVMVASVVIICGRREAEELGNWLFALAIVGAALSAPVLSHVLSCSFRIGFIESFVYLTIGIVLAAVWLPEGDRPPPPYSAASDDLPLP